MRRAWQATALVAIASVGLGLSACDESLQSENAASDPAELARYLPEETGLVQTIDVVEARRQLGLPKDADATPTEPSVLRDGDSPQSRLFTLTTRAFPIVANAYAAEFKANGATPLDGTLIRAAAFDSSDLSIVSTAEPFAQVADKLKRAGYSFKKDLYIKGPESPAVASPVVADGGAGRVVFAQSAGPARTALRRMEMRAEPGLAADALNSVSGSVRFATIAPREVPKRTRCVRALAAAQSATGSGAIMALEISGEKPDPDRFDPSKLKSLDMGTASVLVDALLVPFNVAKPIGKASEPITELISRKNRIVTIPAGENFPGFPRQLPPFQSYDCP